MRTDCVELVYVEPAYDAAVNNMIRRRYSSLCSILSREHCQFVYLPKLLSDSGFGEQLRYRFPDAQLGALPQGLAEDFYREMLAGSGITGPAFVELASDAEVVAAYELPELADADALVAWVEQLVRPDGLEVMTDCCCLAESLDEEDGLVSLEFDNVPVVSLFSECHVPISHSLRRRPEDEESKLEREIVERLAKLRQMGVTEQRLLKLLGLKEPKLSRMLVTKDLRIVMTDYQEQEVKMAALPKALYFLFLKHPEGMMFKQLSDHREELIEYYQMISNRVDLKTLRNSVDDLVDPFSNSINEKCSRIRRAFVSLFDESVAEPYCVSRGSGQLRQVKFDRELLTDMSGLIQK